MPRDHDDSAVAHSYISAQQASWVGSLFDFVTSLPGFASFRQTPAQVRLRPAGDLFLGPPKPVQPEAQKDLIFAWLAEAAYGKTPAGDRARKTHSSRLSEQHSASPCPASETALEGQGWELWSDDFPRRNVRCRIKRAHLRVEVWKRQNPPAVAVAFGGTVFSNEKDWLSNMRWFLPRHRDEYSMTVQVFAPAFVMEFKKRKLSSCKEWAFLNDPELKLYATRHSLGGGLAQQFAYALPLSEHVPRVSYVCAFDPSPVTGYFSVRADRRDHNKQKLCINRVYERGEILAMVRSFTNMIWWPSASSPAIRGARYALFYPANPIAGHSMTELACRMYGAAGLQRDAAPSPSAVEALPQDLSLPTKP